MASLAATAAAAAAAEVTHLTQRDAAEIDEQLMGPLGFSVDQLMVRGPSSPVAVPSVVVLGTDGLLLIVWLVVFAGARWVERRGGRCGGKGVGHCVYHAFSVLE